MIHSGDTVMLRFLKLVESGGEGATLVHCVGHSKMFFH